MSEQRTGGFLEYKSRIVFSLLRGVARVGVRFHLPLDQVGFLLKMAYFQEVRDAQKLELEPIAELFGKSLRTISSLNRQFRSGFFAPEREVQLRREIAAHLNKQARSCEGVLRLYPTRSDAELTRALDDLVREGRIVEKDGLFRRNPEDHDFFDQHDLVARIDGLNRQMDVIADTVWARLVEPDPHETAVARTYVFEASDEDFEQLVTSVLDKIRSDAIAADANVGGSRTRRGLTIAAVTLPGDKP